MVSIAILGAGFMGETHGLAYQAMEDVEVVGVFDTNPEKGTSLAKTLETFYWSDMEELLQHSGCQAIDICLPSFLHEQFLIQSAKAQKHIICEKPVTLSVESLTRMLQAVKLYGVHLYVGQVLRFWPQYREAYDCYHSGVLGKGITVSATRLSPHPSWAPWYAKKGCSGGGLYDLHLHDIDYLRWLFGPVTSVHAKGKKTDWGAWNHVVSSLHFSSGIEAVAEGVMGMPAEYPFTMGLRITGVDGVYEYQMKTEHNLETRENSAVSTRLYLQDQPSKELQLSGEDPYAIELRHFVDCIEKDIDSPIIPPSDTLETLLVIEALEKALETGEEVFL